MKILVTAGPTREKLDPVRFLSNRSTGKMGYAIACAARDAGHDVTLVSGPVALAVPGNVCFVPVESAADMAEAVFSKAADQDMIIMAAAVADYRPSQVEEQKIKKQDGEFMTAQEILAEADFFLKQYDMRLMLTDQQKDLQALIEEQGLADFQIIQTPPQSSDEASQNQKQ